MESRFLFEFLRACDIEEKYIQEVPPKKTQGHILERFAIHQTSDEAFQAIRQLFVYHLKKKDYVINKNFFWGYIQFESKDKTGFYSLMIKNLGMRDKRFEGCLLLELVGGTIPKPQEQV